MSLMLTCQEVALLVSDYLDDRMTGWERIKFRIHVAMCKDCREWLRQLEITTDLLGHAPDVDVPPELSDNLLAAFKDWTKDESVPE